MVSLCLRAIAEGRRGMKSQGDVGLIPHDQPFGPLLKVCPFLSQIAPIVPVLPTQPTRKCCAVCILRFELFHGMEEVIGSIPIRSTKSSQQLSEPFRISDFPSNPRLNPSG
jgi:hypothetical protein